MSSRAVNSAIYGKFFVASTGLIQANFTFSLEKNNASTIESVTISEDGLGWYEFNFIPLSIGQYILSIKYGDFAFSFEWTVDSAAQSDHLVNVQIVQKFYTGVTGLVSGDFIKLLEFNNAATAVTATISEEGSGWYDYTFTPNAAGDWIARVDYSDQHFLIMAFVASGTGISYANLALGTNLAGSGIATSINANNLNSNIS